MKGNCINCDKEFDYMPSQKNGKYCSNKCQGEYSVKKRFIKDGVWHYNMATYLKRIRGNKCEDCGITEWLGREISMHVDHIDGDRTNNTYDNLRILCPNCHSQTPTFASKNVSAEGKQKMAESAKNARMNRMEKLRK